MRKLFLKPFSLTLIILLCIGGLSGCGNEDRIDDTAATQSTETTATISTTNADVTATTSESTAGETTIATESPSSTHESNTTDSPQETTMASTPGQTAVAACQHNSTKVINSQSATCTKAGYTGDTYCNDCRTVIKKGTSIAALGHANTELRNQKDATATSDGYTGDTYCKQCGKKIASGQTRPQLDDHAGKVEYIFSDGSSLWIEPDGDIIGTLMAQKTQQVDHLYLEVEKEILRLCNIEREKEGLAPLTWFEDAYCFTQVRAEEASQVWSHTRPNGKNWYTVYNDAGVFLIGSSGENLFETVGHSIEDYAALAVEGWMNSPGHRANILNPNFTRIAIAIVEHDNQLTAAQNFFS